MTHLHLDFETRSRINIKSHGYDAYFRAAEVLMLAWAFDEDEPQLWFPGVPMNQEMRRALVNPYVTKVAWNAGFERGIFQHCVKMNIAADRWLDPKMMARYASLPAGLDKVSAFFGLGDAGKDKDGKRLIYKFSVPATAAWQKKNEKEFHDQITDPEDWQKFCEYCKQDVRAERELLKCLAIYALPEREERIRILDAKINDTGLPVDMNFVHENRVAVKSEKARLIAEARNLTGLVNPNSREQLLDWLREHGYPYGSVAAKKVTAALDNGVSDEVRAVLKLRQMTGKSSTAKLDALAAQTSPDGRLRLCYQYYGAARTGRWAGSGPQPHNFPRSPVEIGAVTVDLRATFKAPYGKKLVVSDLSAIENRGLGWLTSCAPIMEVFEQGLDPYIDFATRLYHVEYDAVTKQQRQMAKPAVLGCGYGLGGGTDKTDKNGDGFRGGLWGYAANMGVEMTQEAAAEAVKIFRTTYPEVPAFWRDIEGAVITAIHNPGTGIECRRVRVGVAADRTRMVILLPSKRRLHYMNPRLEDGAWPDGQPKTDIVYDGLDGVTKVWGPQRTYGGRLTENIVQAIARDILAEGMLRADVAGFEIVGHTHDEIIALAPKDGMLGLPELNACLTERTEWAEDLPLAADGYEGEVYHK